jgi:hypothetical protein
MPRKTSCSTENRGIEVRRYGIEAARTGSARLRHGACPVRSCTDAKCTSVHGQTCHGKTGSRGRPNRRATCEDAIVACAMPLAMSDGRESRRGDEEFISAVASTPHAARDPRGGRCGTDVVTRPGGRTNGLRPCAARTTRRGRHVRGSPPKGYILSGHDLGRHGSTGHLGAGHGAQAQASETAAPPPGSALSSVAGSRPRACSFGVRRGARPTRCRESGARLTRATSHESRG